MCGRREREEWGVCAVHTASWQFMLLRSISKNKPQPASRREDNLAASLKRKRSGFKSQCEKFFLFILGGIPSSKRQKKIADENIEGERERAKEKLVFIALLLHGLKNEMPTEDDTDIARMNIDLSARDKKHRRHKHIGRILSGCLFGKRITGFWAEVSRHNFVSHYPLHFHN